MDCILFDPLYKERVWGGDKFAHFLGRELPGVKKIGESWEIVDRAEDQSVVVNGEFKGLSLRELLKNHAPRVMGSHWDNTKPFPVLIKWLDCQEKLSLQVHPPADIARELGGEPKTENWYIADAAPGALLMAGLKKGTKRADFEAALSENNLESCIHEIKVIKGDSLFVPSGRFHAIGAGNLILEIQQNSDTTYRVYDWGRVGLDGKPREMHVQEALTSIDFNDFEPEVVHPDESQKVALLADAEIFNIERVRLAEEDPAMIFPRGEQPRILSVVAGAIAVNDHAYPIGTNILLPYAGEFRLKAASPSATILITSNFTR
ncbi:MAG: mannose-6-phosphate isomerase [Verrucomicrobia bacterium CG_4_10_14_3_um_filter_43_23]|nr:MAG: mannose-6-phosphate isomerase [Verrucomicrobia bacterium CG1_02_43_26]PIP59161.1 MAG: mannose-6-phosphate isomerase [Verrucomicrobia bacterium CG22_combo_CG10-13_8_21_14_all_43_17]PIX58028.1 MAG: mannose-6-phosphate isomerase [Verrucomicrobia bacterium CG_4_10_14_3_um_filter_43_23]PIY62263.1 MAG: mannose-6-phosphate isomerase [Verrucomicrobia bacterium CG_4_10_14_0_8_um_filter_43_34]PJA43767.1 MAG: mannose-6-phosphate isomerase [Verrucomicrobia bacterium CG_4_9_14_3_um_filter_43_20]